MRAFLSSCLYLVTMLVGACVGLFPTVLPSSGDPAADLNIANSLSGPYTTHVGLVWWGFGMMLASGYIVTAYMLFRGKVSAEDAGYGH
jgi:cytochrome d ubiquinol oxidase subunit II